MNSAPPQESRLLVMAWANTPGRPRELADSLGGISVCLRPFPHARGGILTIVLRYLLCAVETIYYLARVHPKHLVVQNPPIFLPVLAFVYARITGARLMLDSHPVSFGAKGAQVWAAFLGVHRWIAQRSAGVLVASEEYGRTVEGWGASSAVLHEAPTDWSDVSAKSFDRPTVFFVCVFASDEPWREVISAAARVIDIDVVITGNIDAVKNVLPSPPENVRFVGYLDQVEYKSYMKGCTAALCLTTEAGSVMRCAYEAVYAGTPLIASFHEDTAPLFPYAVFTANTPDGIASAIETAVARQRELRSHANAARAAQMERWDNQIHHTNELLGTN